MSELEALVEQLKRDPEKIWKNIGEVSEETLTGLSKHISPYSFVKPPEDDEVGSEIKKAALISYTNMEEDYLKRFIMTSLVGFIYRMQSEYTVDPDNRKLNLSDADEKLKDKEIYAIPTIERFEGNFRHINNCFSVCRKSCISIIWLHKNYWFCVQACAYVFI